MNMDLSGINQPVSNSARSLIETHRQQEKAARDEAKAKHEQLERDKRLVAGAEASIAQIELLKQEVELLQKQNAKLMEMYDEQVAANEEAKEELKRSRQNNTIMRIIAIIAALAAVASPIVTYLVSR